MGRAIERQISDSLKHQSHQYRGQMFQVGVVIKYLKKKRDHHAWWAPLSVNCLHLWRGSALFVCVAVLCVFEEPLLEGLEWPQPPCYFLVASSWRFMLGVGLRRERRWNKTTCFALVYICKEGFSSVFGGAEFHSQTKLGKKWTVRHVSKNRC